jgi:hypothetical protein
MGIQLILGHRILIGKGFRKTFNGWTGSPQGCFQRWRLEELFRFGGK